jgi:hypothetical protein
MNEIKSNARLYPRLPTQVVTRDGAVFDPRLNHWNLRLAVKSHSLNFGRLEFVAPEINDSIKAVLVWYSENKSSSHLVNMFERAIHFFSITGLSADSLVSSIGAVDIINYRASLTKETTWYLTSLSGFIRKWAELGWPGIEPDATELLDEMRLKGNRKGTAVLTMDPVEGPLTDIERQALIDGLKNARIIGELTVESEVLSWLAILLSPRPVQLSALKTCDLKCSTSRDGLVTYILRVPRAKQRDKPSREEFIERPLLPELGKLVSLHIAHVEERLKNLVPDVSQAPLFPAIRDIGNWLDGFEWHTTADNIGSRITSVLEGLSAHSERTGEALNISPIRLRRTLGTHAAMEGHGELVIAALLDHSDTQNAGVYVEARPEIVERIDKAIAMRMAPLAQAFAGVLIDGLSALDEEDYLISDPRYGEGEQAIGGCGSHGFCSLAAPIACYTCRHFRPWLDGPHEEILDNLLSERDRMMGEGSARIASVNDRTILAVAQVIEECGKRRSALPETTHV